MDNAFKGTIDLDEEDVKTLLAIKMVPGPQTLLWANHCGIISKWL